ncbi:MAG TPA: GntP family permease, partial [Verrucomicrobiales bacterium]|nr:GntP family permease [Verrucomicrobiales bacterium]HIL70269.1 GntP family permease [Verrucomicrobiota bacterium]
LGALTVGALTSNTTLEQEALKKNRTSEEIKEIISQPLGQKVAQEFGRTAGKIAILIALAAIIGKCLLDSGAAERIVRTLLKLAGEQKAPLAFLGSGFTLGIPVFFDTLFYLLIPLGKAMSLRTGKNYLLYILCIIAGGSMAHSLVPPTPGPLLVATALDVDIGTMIIGGLLLGVCTCTVGYFYASWANRTFDIPLRPSEDCTLESLQKILQKKDKDLPPFWLAILPILLPVVLIAGRTIVQSITKGGNRFISPNWLAVMENIGDKNMALLISAVVAMLTLYRYKNRDLKYLINSVQDALSSGGIIILITCAGGAFGGMLNQSGIGTRISGFSDQLQIGMLPLAFFVTALVRTSQGSATVAMITSVGILGPLAQSMELGFHPVYLALAIGCGSKPIPWMADSGFWIVCKMSGMTEKETLKTFSPLLTLMGLVGLPILMIASKLFPLTG